MRAAGVSTRRARSGRRAAILSALAPALAAGLIALGAISPALAQDEAPIGPSATIGALGAARDASEASAAAPSAAAPTEKEVTLLPAAPAATATPSGATPSGGAAASAAADAPAALAAAPGAAAPVGGVAASGAVGEPPASAAAAATATPAAAAPVGGPKTFLIDDAAPASETAGSSSVAPDPSASGTPGESSAAVPAVAPAAAVNAPAADGQGNGNPDDAPVGTVVIPSTLPSTLPSTAQQQTVQPEPGAATQGSQVVNYEENQQMPLNEPPLHSLQEFMNEGSNTSPLGVELQEGARRTKSGREVEGLLVVALQPGSPAERAGVHAGHREAHDVLEGAAVAASLVFPPAVLAVPVIETIQLGENYDLIIGVDGNRVTNFIDFQDQLRDAQPGETVYLNILRSGKRVQVPVEMPEPSATKLEP